jgi:hypothetical protein
MWPFRKREKEGRRRAEESSTSQPYMVPIDGGAPCATPTTPSAPACNVAASSFGGGAWGGGCDGGGGGDGGG